VSVFISVEGLDGCGKTTQLALLRDYLLTEKRPAYFLREPGGTPLGEEIRSVVLPSHATTTVPAAEALLMSAARAQLVATEIRPHLQRGHMVICDRYADSTFVYQGYGRGLDLNALRAVTAFATGGLYPDLTLLLDIDPETAMRRTEGSVGHRSAAAQEDLVQASDPSGTAGREEPGTAGVNQRDSNFFDTMGLEFRRRVRDGYLALVALEPARWTVIDATRSIDEVHVEIRAAVSRFWT